MFNQLIDKIGKPGNKAVEANHWYEFAKLIPSRDTAGTYRLYCFEKALSLYKKMVRTLFSKMLILKVLFLFSYKDFCSC